MKKRAKEKDIRKPTTEQKAKLTDKQRQMGKWQEDWHKNKGTMWWVREQKTVDRVTETDTEKERFVSVPGLRELSSLPEHPRGFWAFSPSLYPSLLLSLCLPSPDWGPNSTCQWETGGGRERSSAFLHPPSAGLPLQQRSHWGGALLKKLKCMSNFGQSSLESTKAAARSEHEDIDRGKCSTPGMIRKTAGLKSTP